MVSKNRSNFTVIKLLQATISLKTLHCYFTALPFYLIRSISTILFHPPTNPRYTKNCNMTRLFENQIHLPTLERCFEVFV